jgi:cytidine deaminase
VERISAITDAEGRVIKSDKELLEKARSAARLAYAKYSGFRVGAAVRVGNTIHSGCNIENASYSLTICAERVAIFAAIAAGARRVDAIAVACIDAGPGEAEGQFMPCGACRQVMNEFGGSDLPVHVDHAGSFALSDLLPHAFLLAQK